MERRALAAGLAALALWALLPLAGSRYLLDLATQIAIYALFALSLNLLLGYAGQVSFGHAAFFALGGYGGAILLTTYHWPLVLALPAAVSLSAAAALFIGFFCVRLTAIYFSMLTLAFAMLVWSVAFKWRGLTGGDDGFVGVAVPAFLADRVVFFYFVLGVVGLATALLGLICHSTFGRALVAVRENEVRAAFVGLNTRGLRLAAFVAAGAFAGIAGALFALYNRGMYTESAYWTESASVLVMTVLGGRRTFFGPALGAGVVYVLEVVINQYTQYWPSVMGLILLGLVLFLPDGLGSLGARRRQGP